MRRRRPRQLGLESLEDRSVPALIGLEATDLLVNASNQAGTQNAPKIAMRPDGSGFVVVWNGPDGGGGATDNGIFARVYDGNWQPVGSDFAVNTTTANVQDEPAVAMDGSGNITVVWTSQGQAGGTGRDVVMRRFGPTGTALSAEAFVNTTITSQQSLPSVATNASGAIVVTWSSGPILTEDVFVRLYNAAGSPTSGEIQVNTTTADDQVYPDVAVAAGGNFVVTWTSFNQDAPGLNDFGIFARAFSAAGAATSAEVAVNTTTAGTQEMSRVAIDSSGAVTIVWAGAVSGGSSGDVAMRRFNASLGVLTGETLVNTTTAGGQIRPEIDTSATNGYVVSWDSAGQDGSGIGAYLRRYNGSGAPTSGEVQVNATTAADQFRAVVGIASTGDHAVAFVGVDDIFVRRYAEAPVVQFSSAGSAPSEAGGTSPYNVDRTAAAYVIANVATAVSVTNTGGTATPGADFTTTFPATVTIAAGSTSQTASVALVNDSLFEGNETIIQGLAASANYTIGATSSRTITIVDDDPPTADVAVSVTDGVTTTAPGSTLTYTIVVSNAGPDPATGVSFNDVIPFPGGSWSVAVAGGATSSAAGGIGNVVSTLGLPVGGTVTITLTQPVPGGATGVITNSATATVAGGTNDPNTVNNTGTDTTTIPALSINDVTASETNGATTFAFTVSLNAVAPAGGVSFTIATANGSATTGDNDYAAQSLTAQTIPAGQTTYTFNVTVNGDTKFENNETFFVNVSSVTGASVADAQGQGTITNDDTAPTISVSSPSVTETDSGTVNLIFTLSIPAVSGVAVTGNYATANLTATAGPDYTALASTPFSIPVGGTSATVTVTVNADALFEVNETLRLDLSSLTGTSNAGGTATGTGTITDDDAAASIAVVSGNNQNTIVSTAFGAPLVVAVRNANNTLVQGVTVNFTGPGAGASFTPSPTSGATNASGQASTGTLTANATAGGPYTVSAAAVGGSAPSVNFSLTNLPPTTLSIDSVSITEGNGGTSILTFTVTASPAPATTATVNWATADGTATTADGDYVGASGVLTFNPGDTTKTISITINGDAKFEGNETFAVILSGATNASIGTGTGTGTITNDDTAPMLSINGLTLNEGNSGTTPFIFTVTQSPVSGLTTTVNFATADGTALAGSDYTANSGTLTFAPGETTKTITVLVTGDTVFENTQAFTVVLSSPTNATVATPTGTGTITNDDTAPTLSINSPTASEAGGPLTFTVTRTGATELPISVNYATADGTAVSVPGGPGTPDFTSTSNTLNFAASLAATVTLTFNVPLTNDAVYEAAEQFTATLTAPTGATLTTATGTGTITNDDAAPTIAVNDITVSENGTASFTVTLTGATALPIAVAFATADGTAVTTGSATPGTPDYTATSGTLTFNPSASSTQTLSIPVTLTNDTTNEPTEQFVVNLSGPTNGATLSDSQGVATITDDDAVPSISITDVTLAEGNAGTTSFNFTVTLSAASAQTVTVNFATADGTALAGSDYASASGTRTFAPGVTTQTVTVLVTGDTVFENNQTFVVNLTSPTNATIADNQGLGTITNDDAAPTLTINDVTVSEAAGTLTFTVTRTGATELPLSVDYATADVSAESTASVPGTPDFTATTGTVSIAASLAPTRTATFSIALTDDNVYEAVEQFFADLSNPTNATIADPRGLATILDDDAAPTLSIDDITVSENGTATFTITLTGATALSIGVDYATADGSALSTGTATPGTPDYTITTGSLTFSPSASGTQTLTVTVPLTDDTTAEDTETFVVNLSNPTNASSISDAQGVATVTDDDPPPTVSVDSVTMTEGNVGTTAFTFTLTLSAPSGQTITVDYTTIDGTAAAGSDYTPVAGTATFAPGETTKTVTVLVTGDTVFEAPESFVLALVNGTNVNAGAQINGTGTIRNDDTAPTLTIDDVTVSEAAGTLTFTVTRTGATEVTAFVDYATTADSAVGTAGGPGTPDFSAATGTLTFAASLAPATQTVTIALTDDNVYEAVEQFFVNLSNVLGATIADPQGLATILDDDAAPTISVGDITVSENGTATFTVTLTGATALPIGFDFITADGTAVSVGSMTPGTPDYTTTGGSLTFAPSASGTQTLTFTVPLTDDATNEADETFVVNLSNPTNASSISDAQGQATITNDDPVSSASVDDVTAAEGNSGTTAFTFTVTLSAASAQTVTVNYQTLDGTALAGSDYVTNAGTLTFAPGVTTQTVTVLVTGDLVFEPDQSFTLNLSNPTNATIADAQGLGSITNDDAPPTLAINSVTVSEGAGTLTFTVTRTGATEVPITVNYATADGTATAGSDYTATSGTLTFAPSLAATATQTFTVTLTGDTADELTETITATLSGATGATLATATGTGTVTDDDLPVAAADTATVLEDGSVTAPTVLGNDNRAPGSVAELVGPTTPNGTLTLNPDGTFTYAPARDFNGTDTFQYRVRNTAGEVSAPATVTITVTPVNDVPSFTKGPDPTVGRGGDPETVPGWATSISAGPANEAAQSLTFLVTVTGTTNTLAFDVAPAVDPTTGALTFEPTATTFGTATVTVQLRDTGGTANGGVDASAAQTFTITVTRHASGNDRPVDQLEFPQYAAAPGPGGPGTADVFNPDGSKASSTVPFGAGVGVRAVLADVTGDGTADVIAGTGPGVPGRLTVTDPTTGKTIFSDFPFGAGFTGGLFVAAGDVNADGRADLIVSPDASGGGRVVVYDGATGRVVASFLGIDDAKFRGGARVAVGDVNGDGVTDVIVSAGRDGGPRVAVFDGTSLTAGATPKKLINDFFAFDENLRDGVYVAAGDLNGDGFADLIFGGGPGGGARVLARDGKSLFGPGASGQFVTLTNLLAGDASLRSGVQVAVKNADGDGLADLVTAVQTPSGPDVRLYLGKTLGPGGGPFVTDLDPYPGLLTGIYVG